MSPLSPLRRPMYALPGALACTALTLFVLNHVLGGGPWELP